jgi:rhomboid protease GluP
MRWRLDRLRERFSRLLKPDPKDQRPRLCPACRALVGSTATKCHECGASLNYSLAAASQSLSGILPAEYPVTYVVMIVNFVLFAVTLMATVQATGQFSIFGSVDGRVLYRLGAMWPFDIVVGGEWWRLVMPIFLHGGIMHIFFNSWVLVDIGRQVEAVYGSPRYLFLYVLTGIGGFVVSMAWSLQFERGQRLAVGASASLLGLIGLMLAITQRRGGAYMQMVRGQLVKWIVYIGVLGLLIPGIDNAAHAGGLAVGYVCGRIFMDREPVTGPERKRAYLLGWIAGFIVVAAFGAVIARRLMEGN